MIIHPYQYDYQYITIENKEVKHFLKNTGMGNKQTTAQIVDRLLPSSVPFSP